MIEQILSKDASTGVGPYSQAVKANGFIFVSGQLGIDPKVGSIIPGGTEAEMYQAIENIDRILRAAGSGWHRVVKVNLYLADLADYERTNEIYTVKLGTVPPARSTIEAASLPAGARVEIDAIALA